MHSFVGILSYLPPAATWPRRSSIGSCQCTGHSQVLCTVFPTNSLISHHDLEELGDFRRPAPTLPRISDHRVVRGPECTEEHGGARANTGWSLSLPGDPIGP